MTLPPDITDAARPRSSVNWSDAGKEPFRVFFPLGILAALIGVALWPLHFAGIYNWYPGQNHARLMAFGFFGAFILGFLGTAMPRMLSARPLGIRNVIALALLHTGMVFSFVFLKQWIGDCLFVLLLFTFVTLMGLRFRERKDLPPPGFILVAGCILSVLAGAILATIGNFRELSPYTLALQHLLAYQGFVLFPILGIGPFILPRFFGLQSAHDFPELHMPSKQWLQKAGLALAAGLLIMASFFVEAGGSFRSAYAVRFVAVLGYLLLEFPFRLVPKFSNAFGASLRLSFGMLVLGFLAVAVLPGYRVALLHLTLVGGFAMVTFLVATRVIFGHSGNGDKLKKANRWFYFPLALILLGMATRISGDFLPQIMASHYSYGAIAFIIGVAIWSIKVLPYVLRRDPEE